MSGDILDPRSAEDTVSLDNLLFELPEDQRDKLLVAIDIMVVRETKLAQIVKIREAVSALTIELEAHVAEARSLQITWREIADAAGINHSTAMRRWATTE